MNTNRSPKLLQQNLDVSICQRPEFVYEANPRVKLWKASDALLDARHADQDHAHVAAIEDGAHLFEAIHVQPVGTIDDDEGTRVGDPPSGEPYSTDTSENRLGPQLLPSTEEP